MILEISNIIFSPNTDLALWNYIAHEIVYYQPEAIDWDFIKENIVFTAGPVQYRLWYEKSWTRSPIKEGLIYSRRDGDYGLRDGKKVSSKEGPGLKAILV